MKSIYNFLKQIIPANLKRYVRKLLGIPKALRRFMLRRPKIIERYIRKYKRNVQAIAFYPEHPCERTWDYTIIRIARELGLLIVDEKTELPHLCMRWQDTTYGKNNLYLDQLAKKVHVINGQCLDISKSYVDQQFKAVFGYDLAINPRQYEGLCVEKSELNGKHDGRIIQCPVQSILDGKVYQRLIDGRCDEQFVVDYRIPIFKDLIPIVFLKYKPISDRFGLSVKAGIALPNDIFNQKEIENIIQFCKRMGLEYGELDIVRDQTNQKIYIVDVNNTPTVRFTGYHFHQRRKIIRMLAKAFQEAFLS